MRSIVSAAGAAVLVLSLLPVSAGAGAGTITGTGQHDPALVEFHDQAGTGTTTDTETIENRVELTLTLEGGAFRFEGTGFIVYRHSVTWHNTPDPCHGLVWTTREIRYEGEFDPGNNNMLTGTYVPAHQESVQDPVTCPENLFEHRIDDNAHPWSAQLDPSTGRVAEIEGPFLVVVQLDPAAVAALLDDGAGTTNGSLTLGQAIGMIQIGSAPIPGHLLFNDVDIFADSGGCAVIIEFFDPWPGGFGNPGDSIPDFVLGFQSSGGFSGGFGLFDGAPQEVGDGFTRPPTLTDDGRIQLFLPLPPHELVGGGMSIFATGVMDTHRTFDGDDISDDPPPEGRPLFEFLADWQTGDVGPTDSEAAGASEEGGGGFPWILLSILGAVGVGGYLWKRGSGVVAPGEPDDQGGETPSTDEDQRGDGAPVVDGLPNEEAETVAQRSMLPPWLQARKDAARGRLSDDSDDSDGSDDSDDDVPPFAPPPLPPSEDPFESDGMDEVLQ